MTFAILELYNLDYQRPMFLSWHLSLSKGKLLVIFYRVTNEQILKGLKKLLEPLGYLIFENV